MSQPPRWVLNPWSFQHSILHRVYGWVSYSGSFFSRVSEQSLYHCWISGSGVRGLGRKVCPNWTVGLTLSSPRVYTEKKVCSAYRDSFLSKTSSFSWVTLPVPRVRFRVYWDTQNLWLCPVREYFLYKVSTDF